MTPALSDILRGNFLSLATPAPVESQGDFMTGKVAVIALLSLLAAQEAERGSQSRVWENAAIAAVLRDAAATYGQDLLAVADTAAEDLSIPALDAANATLRRGLIALHEAVEAAGDLPRHRSIIALYGQMAEARRLDLPPLPAG
jgi:hypothetical protein